MEAGQKVYYCLVCSMYFHDQTDLVIITALVLEQRRLTKS